MEPIRVGAFVLGSRALVILLLAGAMLIWSAMSMMVLVGGRRRARRYFCRSLVATIQRMGPTFIKIGQILQTRRDVLPAVLCEELAALQDSTAPLAPAQARAAFQSIYGPSLQSIFSQIDYHPIACGSIACVYRARLHDGREAAVKLRRPGIAATMAADLHLLRKIGALIARMPPFRSTPVGAVLDQVSAAVYGQLDLARELSSLKSLRENLSKVPRLWVPAVFEEASRDQALAMEFIPELDTSTAGRCSETMRRRFAATTLAAAYRMLFVEGFVHCDLHPGNLYFTKSGFVVVLDAGFSVQLSERIRRLFAEFFLNIGLGAGRYCAELVMASAVDVDPDADIERFTAQMEQLVERNSGVTAAQFSLMAFAVELFDLQRRFGLHAAPEMIFPLLSLLVIEGTVRDLDPDVDFQNAARPVLMEGLFGSRS